MGLTAMQAEIQADHRREQLVRERNIRNDHFREARTKVKQRKKMHRFKICAERHPIIKMNEHLYIYYY